jgi:sugar-specific transcriptional regulator TrmB
MVQNITVSPQAVAIYRRLDSQQSYSAQNIANELNILPNTVYRAIKELTGLGLVERVESYPLSFKKASPQKAMSLYLQAAAQNFRHQFGTKPESLITTAEEPLVTLVKDRSDMLHRENSDVRAAIQSIDFIVSGLEVPDAMVLAFRKAATVGVAIRAIVQQKRETSSERLERWQELGATVKYLPGLKLRLVVIDQRISYLTSYNPSDRNSAFGVRFDYEPLAVQMSEVFEQNWQHAQTLNI